jgi:hypothetical protein
MTRPLGDLPLMLADVPWSLRCALEQEGVPIADLQNGRDGRFVLFDSRRGAPILTRDQIGIDIDHLRRGRTHDPFTALADEQAASYEWQIPWCHLPRTSFRGTVIDRDGREYHPTLSVRETVARVDRAAVRQRLLTDLRTLLEAAGGMWLRISPYPYPYRTAFNLRLDHDQYDAGDLEATLEAVEGHEHAVSHYVCAATHTGKADMLARLKGAHVGSHGWWHHTYREPSDNLSNVRRGIDSLRSWGFEPVGFAAPHGRFHRGLLTALDELDVTHSSEFSLAYDDVPFFPRQSNVLQIPIHPICLGLCLDAARRMPGRPISDDMAAELVVQHWLSLAAEKHRAGEPIFFYGHPDGRLGRFPHVLEQLLAAIDQLAAVWQTTLSTFEKWWRARSAVRLRVVQRNDCLEMVAEGLPPSYRCAIDYVRGREVATIELAQATTWLSSEALPWRQQGTARTIRSSRLKCSTGLRVGLHRYLDWEKVTPIDQISAQTWRGWAKRTLRRVCA